MKKIWCILLVCSFISASAQQKFSPESARELCAKTMAGFTQSVSFAYSKGMPFETFRDKLCSRTQPMAIGNDLIRAAHNYLSSAQTGSEITRADDGKLIAAALKYIYAQEKKEIHTDGAEMFGDKIQLELSSARDGKCRWYQISCHIQALADWITWNFFPDIWGPLLI